MKSFLIAVLLLAGLLTAARAQSNADDQYIGIYGLMQRADQLAQTGEPGEALAAFADAQAQLQQFQKIFPEWNPNIVSFRLSHIADKIAGLKNRASLQALAGQTNAPSVTTKVAPPVNTLPSSAELDGLRTQLQSAQTANELLQTKLKEALAVQPAAVDPRELERAQEKIRSLMKENDLLKVSRVAAVTNLVSAPVETRFITNDVRTVVVDTNALEMLRRDRAVAVKNFNDEHDRAEELAGQLEKLRQASSLAATNAIAIPGAADDGKLAAELTRARAQIAALQSAVDVAALEKLALQGRLQQSLSATNPVASTVDYEGRIRELTQERNDLIERLDMATKQKSGKNTEALAQLSALTSEVTILRSRLAVVEAQPVPYTKDELALLKSSTPSPAKVAPPKKSIKEMPAGTAELVASAQQHFARHEYDQAETDYQKILDHDQNNGLALANIATIEMQRDNLAGAEKHIKAALAESPDDAYNLSMLGYLKFRQEKYDDALNILSRAAQIDPNNPEIQNYLGLTLSHQGQRKAAESALRRAIELAPNYAPAHNNLAVIYLSQQPPLAELARWHYQKALAAGQPHNPDLEKMLAEKGAPVTP